MNKIVLLASTVLTSAVLFSTVNISEKADEVTANNAKHVAQQAMKTAVAIPTYRISTLSKIKEITTKSTLVINLVQV